MSAVDWSQIKHFERYEFDSPDLPGSGSGMQAEIVRVIDGIREELGYPLYVNSGIRTQAHNQAVGGVDSSAHVRGYAVDLKATTSRERMRIVSCALARRINRIGIGKTFVHLDADPDLPQVVLWLY